jgi:hypothetical protein
VSDAAAKTSLFSLMSDGFLVRVVRLSEKSFSLLSDGFLVRVVRLSEKSFSLLSDFFRVRVFFWEKSGSLSPPEVCRFLPRLGSI